MIIPEHNLVSICMLGLPILLTETNGRYHDNP